MNIEGINFLHLGTDPNLNPTGEAYDRTVVADRYRIPPNSFYPAHPLNSAYYHNPLPDIGMQSGEIWPVLASSIDEIMKVHKDFLKPGNFSVDPVYKDILRILKNYAVVLDSYDQLLGSHRVSSQSGRTIYQASPAKPDLPLFNLHLAGVRNEELRDEKSDICLEEAMDKIVTGDAARTGFLRQGWDNLVHRNSLIRLLGFDISKFIAGECFEVRKTGGEGIKTVSTPSARFPHTWLQFSRYSDPEASGAVSSTESLEMSIIIDRSRIIDNSRN